MREKHHDAQGLLPPDSGGFVSRDYDSYDEYVEHQRQKLDESSRSATASRTRP